ncbi:hypothetical protein MKW92_048359 [Papaver armeniacum]|nr:hypothetical protein MKW92_048359 [Papaver armeniacum]
MALSRLALKKVVSTSSTSVLLPKQLQPQQYLVPRQLQFAGNQNTYLTRSSIPRLFATSSDNTSSEGAIDHNSPSDLFSAGVGDALLQATNNLNKLFENWAPSGLIGRMKENESRYKLRYELPGLTKEDVKITVHDNFLTIKGEHREEEEEEDTDEDDDEHWSASRYGYYETSFMLPDDAKVDEIKAEMKGGVLSITIPRTEDAKPKDIKEIEIS